jgi:Fur family ferric uptake transcriptional regulator
MRKTIAKTKILELISQSKTNLSHSDIQSQLPEGLCDRVTIYRVLDRLLQEGLIHKVVNIDGVINYAICKSCDVEHKHNHAHFSCEKCKSVTCLDDIVPVFDLPEGYHINQLNFVISGLCANCS